MVRLYRDPNGTALFRGRTIVSSSAGSISQGNPLRADHVQQIETLRKRVRELESMLNQPNSHDPTESSRERELQVESVNRCFMQQEGGGRRVGFTEDVCFTGEELSSSDHCVEPTQMTPCGEGARETVCANSCLGEGDECNRAARETEIAGDSNVINNDTVHA